MAEETDAEPPDDDRFEPADSLSLDEALALVGEETRARIVVELGEAVREDGLTPATLSFSELMDRADVDDSGRFNYHLDRLVGSFVRKTDAGYTLRPPGHFLYRAVVAGTLSEHRRLDPFTVDDCPDCGGTLVAEYPGDHCLYVRCRDCGTLAHTVRLPDRGVDGRSNRELVDVAVRKGRHEQGLLREGICHACSARVDRRLQVENPLVCGGHCDYDVYAVLACSACNVGGAGHPAPLALTTPPAVGFFADHDRDARGVPPWSDVVTAARRRTRVLDDGTAVEIPFDLGSERLTVRLDADLRVVDADRSPV